MDTENAGRISEPTDINIIIAATIAELRKAAQNNEQDEKHNSTDGRNTERV